MGTGLKPYEPANLTPIHKNILTLLAAGMRAREISRMEGMPTESRISIIRNRNNLPHHLLVVGPNSSNIPIEELAKRHGIARAVKHYPNLPHGRLAKIYTGADVFALPTTYEGISRTIYEAMASGTPVLTVDHPTLSEGGADAVLSIPTPAVEDLAQGLGALLTNTSLRREYEQKGRDRIRRFSMRECAKATMAVLDRVALPSDRLD